MNLATRFSDAPIKRKLMLIGLLTSGLALLSISLILAAWSWVEWQKRTVSDLTTYAKIIGTNAAPAMLFEDRNAATETLAALAVNPDIVDVVIYDKEGREFARYIAPQHSPGAPLPLLKPGVHQFNANQMAVTEVIKFKNEVMGTIYLEADLRGLYAAILENTILTFVAASGVFLASIFLFARLQKVIVSPIMDLSDVMRKVSVEQNYSIRAAVHSKDEIGMLARAFNEMLERIQQAQEKLVNTEKLALLGKVAGSVGHELRNPLGVMSNAVYFLQTVLSDADETTKEYLNIINSEITVAERMASDLMDAVRTRPPNPDVVGVAELIAQTLRKCAMPPSINVKLNIPATLPSLRVDVMQIQKVFRNLINNGVEAMPEGGVLEISAIENKPERTISFSVHDSGSGIAPEHLSKLFQPLFTTKARGIGLGLVVVKNLTEANGGRIAVESKPGKGTMFTVALPVETGAA